MYFCSCFFKIIPILVSFYNVQNQLGHVGPLPAPVDEKPETVSVQEPAPAAQPAAEKAVRVLLFKTPTCPNCKAAAALLDKEGIEYTALNANEEKDLVGKFGIKQAPTLVIMNDDGFEKFRGVSDIRGWLKKRA